MHRLEVQFLSYLPELLPVSAKLSQEDVQLNYQMLLMGRKDLVASPDMHLGFEMLMLRLLAFQPESKVSSATSAIRDTQASEVNTAKKSEAAAEQKPQVQSEDTPKESPESSAEDLAGQPLHDQLPEDQPQENETLEAAHEEDVAESSEASVVTRPDSYYSDSCSSDNYYEREVETEAVADMAMDSQSDASASSLTNSVPEKQDFDQSERVVNRQESDVGEPKTLEEFDSDAWIPLFRVLPLGGAVKSVVSHMVLDEQTNGRAKFRLAEAGQPLFNPNHQRRLEEVLTTHFGSPVDVDVELGSVDRETPAENARRLHREALAAAEKNILGDPLVAEFMNEFQAQLVPDSVTFCDTES